MSAILILGMPADHEQVRNVTGALSESGLDVFWDRPRDANDWKAVRRRLDDARCVILFWSGAVAGEDAGPYLSFARRALAADKLIAVRLSGGVAPAGLERATTYDLRGWRARASSIFMLDLVSGAQAKVAGLDPPLPRAPRQLLFKRLAILIPSLVGVAALLIGLYRDIGIDKIPSGAESTAWTALHPGSCKDLRGFVSRFPDGVYAAQAQALLDGRRETRGVAWERVTRPLDLYTPLAGVRPSATLDAARADAQARADRLAQQKCGTLAAAGRARLIGLHLAQPVMRCEPHPGGQLCTIDATLQCALDEPAEAVTEICGAPG